MRKTIDFLLNDWLDVPALAARPRYADHSRATFDSVLDTCERIAAEKFAPFNRLVDVEEPKVVDGNVVLPQCSHEAARAYVESGMLAAAQDYELGGMQLPYVVDLAANVFFAKAGIGLGGGGMLTAGNATPYLQAFGHVVLAWLWLDVARAAVAASTPTDASERAAFLRGKLQAARYFVDYELPKIDGWLSVVAARNTTCLDMRDEWYAT